MELNYSLLNGRIIEKCGTRRKFAEKMGISFKALSLKLNNKVKFSQDDVIKAIEILDIKDNELKYFFFMPK